MNIVELICTKIYVPIHSQFNHLVGLTIFIKFVYVL
jgi:hypothetical protein